MFRLTKLLRLLHAPPATKATREPSGHAAQAPPDQSTREPSGHAAQAPPDQPSRKTPGHAAQAPPDQPSRKPPGHSAQAPPDHPTREPSRHATQAPPDPPAAGQPAAGQPAARQHAARQAVGPVVIWNLTRTCNLSCKHCYANSGPKAYEGELTTAEALAVMADLRRYRVPVLLLSGGEPLLRPDIFDLGRAARDMGFFVGLSTNGVLLDDAGADSIALAGFDYVGISLDGMRENHDRFRRKAGAFDASLAALERCRDRGLKVGVRFTLTEENKQDLAPLLDLALARRFEKFYLSHLNYAGRGNVNRRDDAYHRTTREAMTILFEEAWRRLEAGYPDEIVTGNNDADGAYLLLWAAERFATDQVARLRSALEAWGGNSTGVGIANIDHLGNVHPDTMWWDHTLGNVRERPFSAIWSDNSDPLLAGLRRRPREVGGRCGTCRYLAICGGNTRVRAWQLTGDPWAEDPGCYLEDAEIGVGAQTGERATA